MLSLVEKIVFVIIALSAMGASFITFGKMFRAIGRGTQAINWKDALLNFSKGLIKSELEPAMVVEIELLESFKRERISMHDIGQAILPGKYK